MKKIKFLTLLILTLMAAPAFSQSCTETASSMCPAVPKVNGPVSAAFSKYTGMNAIIATTLESQVRKQLNEALTGDFKVDITPLVQKACWRVNLRASARTLIPHI